MKSSQLAALAALSSLLAVAGCDRKAEDSGGAPEPAAEAPADREGDEAPKAAAEPADRKTQRAKGEHRSGKGKWKEPGVYLDGEPIAFIKFAELPLSLEPVWVEGEMDVEFKAGEPPPEPKKVKYRRYRLAD